MTFTLIPNSGQSLDDTRDGIRTNFSILRTAQNLNHGDIDTGDQGKHKFLQMPQQGSDPATAANESAFYTKDSGGYPNFFIRNESNGQVYKLTAMDDANIATFATNPGWTFLPGGLLLQYGVVAVTGSPQTITFSKAFSANPYSIILTAARSDTKDKVVAVKTGTISTTQFQASYSGSDQPDFIEWMAIGAS